MGLTPPSRLSTPSGSSQQTNLTSCPRNSGGNYPQTRLSTASSGCSLTPGWTQYRGPWTTCPSPLHCTGNQTCDSPVHCRGPQIDYIFHSLAASASRTKHPTTKIILLAPIVFSIQIGFFRCLKIRTTTTNEKPTLPMISSPKRFILLCSCVCVT